MTEATDITPVKVRCSVIILYSQEILDIPVKFARANDAMAYAARMALKPRLDPIKAKKTARRMLAMTSIAHRA